MPDDTIRVSMGAPSTEALEVVGLHPPFLSIARGASDPPPVGERVDLFLSAAELKWGPLAATVVPAPAPEEGAAGDLHVRLEAVPPEMVAPLVKFLHRRRSAGIWGSAVAKAHQVVLSDETSIWALLRALFAYRARARLVTDGRTETLATVFEAVTIDPAHALPLRWAWRGDLPPTPFEIEVEGTHAIYRIPVPELERIGDHVALPVPDHIDRLRCRRGRRAPADHGARPQIRFAHPLCKGLEVTRPVSDVSDEGLSFFSRPTDDLLFDGLEIPEAIVEWPAGPPVRVRASLRHAGPVCGVRVHPRSDQDNRRWLSNVDRLLHPDTRIGHTWSGLFWSLFEDSGYFFLSQKTPDHFVPLRKAFGTVNEVLDAHPELGCSVVWPTENRVEAAVAATRVYAHAWMMHHLAKRRRDERPRPAGRLLLRDIYTRALEHARRDPEMRWLIAYGEEGIGFTQRVHRDFVQEREGAGDALVVTFRLMEMPCDDRPMPGGLPVEIGEATPAELNELFDVVRAQRSPAYADALDLVPERFDLGVIRAAYEDAGLSRARTALVARSSGRAVAAAVLETASPGIHLFRFLDGARLYSLRPGGWLAFTPLLAAARPWFRAQGRESFMYLHEEPGRPPAGLRDLDGGFFWLIAAHLIPAFLEHLHLETGPEPGFAQQNGGSG